MRPAALHCVPIFLAMTFAACGEPGTAKTSQPVNRDTVALAGSGTAQAKRPDTTFASEHRPRRAPPKRTKMPTETRSETQPWTPGPQIDDRLWGQLQQRQRAADRIRGELLHRHRAGLLPTASDLDLLRRIDSTNADWFSAVVAERGWPGPSVVGPYGAEAAFRLVEAADTQRAFQLRMLRFLERAREAGDATGEQVALLTDRLLLAQGQPQRYGTHRGYAEGRRALKSPFDPDFARIDARRREMGLRPLSDYFASPEDFLNPAPVLPDSTRALPPLRTAEEQEAIARKIADLASGSWAADDLELRYAQGGSLGIIGPSTGELILRRRNGQWSAFQLWRKPYMHQSTPPLDSLGRPQDPPPLVRDIDVVNPEAVWQSVVDLGLLTLPPKPVRDGKMRVMDGGWYTIEVRTAEGYRRSVFDNPDVYRTPADLKMLRIAKVIENALSPGRR